MAKNIVLQDIATALEIDKSTVSRALNDSPRLPKKTRDLVKKKAAELGYIPDPALRRLSDFRWGNKKPSRATSLAFVRWSKKDFSDFTPHLHAPLTEATENLGYGFESLCIADYPNVSAAVRVLQARGVTGAVILASQDEKAWENFPWDLFSAVKIFFWHEKKMGLDLVLFDNFDMLLDAGKRVAKAKPKSAGVYLVRSKEEPLTDLYSHAAGLLIKKQWNQAGIRCNESHVFLARRTTMPKIALKIVKEKVEIAIVKNDSIRHYFSHMGLSVPKDLQIIALDRGGDPNIAGYERQPDLIALYAVQHLDSLVRQGKKGLPQHPRIILVPNRWVSGKTFIEKE